MDHDFYEDMDDAATDIASMIAEQINQEDYILFGHSMGALIAYEVYYKLLERNQKLPEHIFFSGKGAPDVKYSFKRVHLFDDHKFLQVVSLYGGLPVEFYNEEIKELFLPILRADFRLLGEYVFHQKQDKIQANITVLYGDNDFSTKLEEIQQWENHGGKECRFYKCQGDHFFINDQYSFIIELMENI